MEKTKGKKILKWVLGIIGGLVGLFITGIVVITLVLTRDERIAKDPDRILSQVDLKLPAYEVLYYDNNMNRSQSAWSEYEWMLKLKEPLNEKDLSRLDKKVSDDRNWSYDAEEHWFVYDSDVDDPHIRVVVFTDSGKVQLEYMWYDILY